MRTIRDQVLLTLILALTLAGCHAGEEPNADSAEATSAETAAGATGPVANCSELSGIIDRMVCFADLASAAGNRTPCDAAAEEGVRFQCYAIFAERVGDPEACRAIPPRSQEHVDLRDVCLADVAPVIENTGLCEEIVAAGLKDSCYLNVFRKTGDPELCDRIEDPGQKSLCTGEPVIVTP